MALGTPQGDTLVPLIDELLATLSPAEQEMQNSGRQLLEAAVKRARQFEAEGMKPQAKAVWESVIALYGDDQSAADEVEEARAAVSTGHETTPSATEDPAQPASASPPGSS